MSTILKTFLSMSFSGGLLILTLLLGKRFLKDKISRQWQYYIWLLVILRLLLPFSPEISLMGKAYQAVDQAITRAAPPTRQENPLAGPEGAHVSSVGPEQGEESANLPAQNLTAAPPRQDIGAWLTDHIWLIWPAAALGLLIRKITIYQGFVRYIHAGMVPVSDVDMLDRLSAAAERAGVRAPVELCVNPLVSSPLLIGFFHPCIVLPGADIPETDFQYIALHELTHYRRRDMFYKWLAQITVCLHWFNPLVHLMNREITSACEFSCDEAVLAKMGHDHAQDYGQTLLDAMAAVGKYRENPGAVTLSENKRLLKERLSAIMNFRKKSTATRCLTGALTLCVVFCAVFVGVYPASAADASDPANAEKPLPVQSGHSPAAEESPAMETLDVNGKTFFLVHNEAQLRAIGTGEYGMDRNYMQQADIRLSTDEWAPIGTWDAPFTGTFNGNGFEIIGLTMTDPDAEIVGLFGVAKNAHIYNVTMRDYDIAGAGGNIQGKSVGAVLAIGQGSRSYDNFVYPKETGEDITQDQTTGAPLSEAARYYEADSLPLFQIAFSRLDGTAQGEWLEKLYAGDDFAFFSVAVRILDGDDPLIAAFAERAYGDGEIAFFSTLTDCMDKADLERWLDRALEDGKWSFQSMLFNKLDRNDEFDELEEQREKEWEAAQRAEYQAAGVTMDGKNYYYQGQLVNIFLDVRKGGSFYVLDMNPKGTVNVRITRSADDKITGAACMTDAEAASLLGDMEAPEGEARDKGWDSPDEAWDNSEIVSVPVGIEKVKDGEYVWLGTYTLNEGDRVCYNVSAESGEQLDVGFAKPGQTSPEVRYYMVSCRRTDGKLEVRTETMMWKSPVDPGEYRLFLHTEGGALAHVSGSVTIIKAAQNSQ